MITPLSSGVVVRKSNRIKASDLVMTNTEVINHEMFPTWKYQIWIFDNIIQTNLSKRDMYELAVQDREVADILNGVRIALVTDDPVLTEMCRIYQYYSRDSSWEIRILTSLARALQWAHYRH